MRIGKYALMSLLVVTIVVSFFINNFARAADDKSIFEERLSAYLKNSTVTPSPVLKDVEKSYEDLLQFVTEFPASEYTNDVEFIKLFTLYGANKFDLVAWQNLAQKSPNGKASPLTKDLFKKYLGSIPPEMGIPYSLWVLRIKGGHAWLSLRNGGEENYADAIKYLSEFVKELDYTDALQKEAAFTPYIMLLDSYRKLGQKDGYDKTKAEILSLFPERSDRIEKIKFSSTP